MLTEYTNYWKCNTTEQLEIRSMHVPHLISEVNRGWNCNCAFYVAKKLKGGLVLGRPSLRQTRYT